MTEFEDLFSGGGAGGSGGANESQSNINRQSHAPIIPSNADINSQKQIKLSSTLKATPTASSSKPLATPKQNYYGGSSRNNKDGIGRLN